MMDPAEQLLPIDEENLSVVDLEKIVRQLTEEVERHREELTKQKGELQDLHAEETERSRSRERYVSLFVQIMDLQEALEEEEKTWQQLREVNQEMERLSKPSELESSEVLESRSKEMENLIAAYQEKEKKLQEESKHLKSLLEKSKEELVQSESEHRRVEEELHAAQTALSDYGGQGLTEMELLLDSCIREVRQLNILPGKKRHKK
ncbi:myosin heavy chain, cardiac muscle isoform-like [Rana temporaria]|uniref:myosin heavy chain, cardiac muscle isoform-like n=1 Tax=Rana temporaria TaxID=8407 RepID=UPI001AAE0476|nr:myosin heavy chain, cardiac muscle isoform-like [Rana temporaria]